MTTGYLNKGMDKIYHKGLESKTLFTFTLCLLVLIVRGYDRLSEPGLWAEDSTFLVDSLTSGWRSVLWPLAGSYQLFPRVITTLSTYLNFSQIPLFITIVSIVTYAAIASQCSRADYLPWVRQSTKILFAVFVCLMPGLSEILGNLCNLHRLFLLWALLIAFKDLKSKLTYSECFFLVIALFSAGEAVIVLPVFCYRVFKRWHFKNFSDRFALISALTSMFTLWLASHTLPGEPLALSGLIHPLASSLNSILVQPILGWRLTLNLQNHFPLLLIGLGWAMLFCIVKILSKASVHQAVLVLSVPILILLVQVMGWIARPYDVEIYQDIAHGREWWEKRECYFLALSGFFLYTSLLDAWIGLNRAWLWGFLALTFILSPQLSVSGFGKMTKWQEMADQLQELVRSGRHGTIEIPIFPDPLFRFKFERLTSETGL